MTIEEALKEKQKIEIKKYLGLLKKALKMPEIKQKSILESIQECAKDNDAKTFSILLLDKFRKMNEKERTYAIHALHVLKKEVKDNERNDI